MAKRDYRNNNGKKGATTTTQTKTAAELREEAKKMEADLGRLRKAAQIAEANEKRAAETATKSGDKPKTAAELRAEAEALIRQAEEAEAAERAEQERQESISGSAGYTGPQKAWSYRDEKGAVHVTLNYLVASRFTPNPGCVPVWVKNGQIDFPLTAEECGHYGL